MAGKGKAAAFTPLRSLAKLAVAIGLALFTPGLLSAAGAQTRDRVAPESRQQALLSYAPVVKRVAPAVVNVYVQHRVKQISPFFDDPFFRQFFGREFGQPSERLQNSLGSGVIVTPDGLVVTNNHVIAGDGQTGITVALADNREFPAKLILKDERTDLAVLRIEGAEGDFPYLAFANSDAVEVGDIVLAIGNPFGVGQTVTNGIVSALARTRVGISDYQFFIQTDAAINPGNSGGALVDMDGRLIGINTAIYTRSGGSQGIGFAIPSNMVRVVVDAALQGGRVKRPWLGAQLESLTPDIAQTVGLDRAQGALVASVQKNSPAERGGLRPGDVVLSIDGKPVTDAQAFLYYFTTKGLNGSVAVEAMQPGGRKRSLSIALMPAPETPPRDVQDLTGVHPFEGARVANLSPAVADELSLNETTGVVILETQAYSTARRVGFKPGDIVARVNGQEIETIDQLKRVLAKRRPIWQIDIIRGGRELRTVLRG